MQVKYMEECSYLLISVFGVDVEGVPGVPDARVLLDRGITLGPRGASGSNGYRPLLTWLTSLQGILASLVLLTVFNRLRLRRSLLPTTLLILFFPPTPPCGRLYLSCS